MKKDIIFKTYNEEVIRDKELYTFIASKEVKDRDGDIIKISGIKTEDFEKNPVIFFNHKHSDLPIGRATKLTKRADQMDVEIEFADHQFAQVCKRMVETDFLNGVSMGFKIDYKTVESNNDARIINDCLLAEISLTGIPANQDTLRIKGFSDIEIKSLKDNGMIEKKEEKNINTIEKAIDDLQKENDELRDRVVELEFQLEENEPKSIYDDIFSEFSLDSDSEALNDDHITSDEGSNSELTIEDLDDLL